MGKDTSSTPSEVFLGMSSDQVFSAGDTLCVHVWGDMSCNKLLALFLPTSVGDEPALPGIDEFEVATLDFHGWQYIHMVVPNGYSHFGGFRMVPTDSRMGLSGTLLIALQFFVHILHDLHLSASKYTLNHEKRASCAKMVPTGQMVLQ